MNGKKRDMKADEKQVEKERKEEVQLVESSELAEQKSSPLKEI